MEVPLPLLLEIVATSIYLNDSEGVVEKLLVAGGKTKNLCCSELGKENACCSGRRDLLWRGTHRQVFYVPQAKLAALIFRDKINRGTINMKNSDHGNSTHSPTNPNIRLGDMSSWSGALRASF